MCIVNAFSVVPEATVKCQDGNRRSKLLMIIPKLLFKDSILARHLDSYFHVWLPFNHGPLAHREQCLIKLRLIDGFSLRDLRLS
jgi:hypothetical protein